MKNISPVKVQTRVRPPTAAAIEAARQAVREALASVEDARQKCLLAGQMLNEFKLQLPHGQFEAFVREHLPEISERTAQCWARAAGNVAKALPPYAADAAPVSGFLRRPDAELTEPQRAYKQSWLDFTGHKTIRECMAGVFVDGDAVVRADRAINGLTRGGVGMQPDRRAFEKFTAAKLRHITGFLTVQTLAPGTGRRVVSGWRELPPVQQTQIGSAFANFLETAPGWLLEILADKIRQEARLSDAERLSR